MSHKEIGRKIKALRLKKRYKQGDFAVMIKVSRQTLTAIEKGDSPLTFDRAFVIAKALECDIYDFLPKQKGTKNGH